MTERRCGACKWYQPSELEAMGYCKWPAPLWLIQFMHAQHKSIPRDYALMDKFEGDTCPTWEPAP